MSLYVDRIQQSDCEFLYLPSECSDMTATRASLEDVKGAGDVELVYSLFKDKLQLCLCVIMTDCHDHNH